MNYLCTQNMDESENNYAEWKKLDKKKVHTIRFHFCKTLEMQTGL